MRCLFSTITLLAVVGSTACAPRSALQPQYYYRTPTNSDVLTQHELASVVGAQNTYVAIEQLRPLFLTSRPGPDMVRGIAPQIAVFIDGSLAGDLDVLKTIPLSNVESIKRVRQPLAYADYGRYAGNDGVVAVRLRWPKR
jgi:hypothetical protein